MSKRTLERRLAQGKLPQAKMIDGEWKVPSDPNATAESTDTTADTDLADDVGGAGGGDGASQPDSDGDGGDAKKAPSENDGAAGGDGGAISAQEAAPGFLPSLVYQHRIGDLEAQIADLKADKERLYGLLETAQDNLKREQTLRLLSAPTEAAPDDQHPEAGQGGQAETPRAESQSGEGEAPSGGLWARLKAWRRQK